MMPAGDGTGPMGAGPMSGRAMGYCAGYDMPGFAQPMPGRGMGMGFGWGRGRGRGRRNRFAARGMAAPMEAPPAPDVQAAPNLEGLKARMDHMEKLLNDIRQQLAQYDSADKKEA